MPSRNFELDSEDRENYQQVLDKFEEILNYYNLNILGIILEDMHTSISQRKVNIDLYLSI